MHKNFKSLFGMMLTSGAKFELGERDGIKIMFLPTKKLPAILIHDRKYRTNDNLYIEFTSNKKFVNGYYNTETIIRYLTKNGFLKMEDIKDEC